jgi:putative DNA primase/helicase
VRSVPTRALYQAAHRPKTFCILAGRTRFAGKDSQFGLYRKSDESRPHSNRVPLLTCGGLNDNAAENGAPIDWLARARGFAKHLTAERLAALSAELSVPESALRRLRWLGFLESRQHGPCWTFPETDGRGRIVDINRRYPDGKKKAMAGGRRGLTMVEAWDNGQGPILCPEGASNTLALTAMGLPAVGRPNNKAGVEYLAELLSRLPRDREIIIVGDNDPKPSGEWPGKEGAIETAAKLSAKLERVVLWALPPDNAKDVRQWATARGPDTPDAWRALGGELSRTLQAQAKPAALPAILDQYVDTAPPLVRVASEPETQLQPNEAIDDPHRLARLYLQQNCTNADGITLRHWRQEWHRWDGHAYRTLAAKELGAELTQFVKAAMDRENVIAQQQAAGNGDKLPVVRKVTGRLIADVAHALEGFTMLSGRTESPQWLEKVNPFPANEILACKNGLIHLPSFAAGHHRLLPLTPQFFSFNVLDFDIELDAPRPSAWLDFLARLWPDDEASIAALQEWMGYLLTADTRQQKMLLLIGPKRGGKGTIARVIRALVGPDNVAGPTLATLGTNFGLWPLLGKSVAMISDARLSGRSDLAAVTERLLSVSGEDALTVDRKNLAPVTVKIPARFMILTNELPRLNDASGALAGRMILLRLTQSWEGREDINLTDRLLLELPGILLWAVEGWLRLRERGHFMQPEAGKDLLSDLEDLSSPVLAFVKERCAEGPGLTATVAELFNAWRLWCQDVGRKEPGTEAVFGRDLLAAVPTLRKVRPREGKTRYRGYEGICVMPK